METFAFSFFKTPYYNARRCRRNYVLYVSISGTFVRAITLVSVVWSLETYGIKMISSWPAFSGTWPEKRYN